MSKTFRRIPVKQEDDVFPKLKPVTKRKLLKPKYKRNITLQELNDGYEYPIPEKLVD